MTPKHNDMALVFKGRDVGEYELARGFHPEGTLEDWVQIVQLAEKHPVPMFAVYAAFASPLLHVLHVSSFVVDFSYGTSTGKTTTLRLAASVWGCPDEAGEASVIGSWDTTLVWVERAASLYNGLPLILDDTKRAANPKLIADVVYGFAGGHGRHRGTITGTDSTGKWRGMLLSTGESPILYFTQDGGTTGRVVEVWSPPFGEPTEETGRLVAAINSGLQRAYGTAGPAFMQFIMQNKERWGEWRDNYREVCDRYLQNAGSNPVAGRVAKYLAAVEIAGRLLHEGISMPWEYNSPVDALWDTIIGEVKEADRPKMAMEHVLSWCGSNARLFSAAAPRDDYTRYSSSDDYPIRDIPGRWDDDVIYLLPHKLKEILKQAGFEPDAIIRSWRDRKWIITDNDGTHLTKKARIDGSNQRAYCIDLRVAAPHMVFPTEEESGNSGGNGNYQLF